MDDKFIYYEGLLDQLEEILSKQKEIAYQEFLKSLKTYQTDLSF